MNMKKIIPFFFIFISFYTGSAARENRWEGDTTKPLLVTMDEGR
jgi:hypothetical protein